jgi:hypothetical protein
VKLAWWPANIMNDCNAVASMRDLYSQFCEARDAACKTEDPKEKAEHLQLVMDAASQMIGRLAMLGAGLDSILVSLNRNVKNISTLNPELYRELEPHIGDLMGLHQFVMMGYGDEAEFCTRFEKLVRDKVLVEEGLDPADIEGSFDYMRKKAMMAVTPVNPSN